MPNTQSETPTYWTRAAFQNRFTETERLAMHRASLMAGPTGDAIALALQAFNAKELIISDSANLANTLDSLIVLKILTAERKAQILNPDFQLSTI